MTDILTSDRISLQATVANKADAIRQAGALLVESGCVLPAYVDGMLKREETMSTFLGNGVAIPHGMHENVNDVKQTGISVLQIPAGVQWDDDDEDSVVHLVVGIASNSDAHMGILVNLAEVIEDEEMAESLATTSDPDLILEHLNREPSMEDDDYEDDDDF